MTDCPTVPTSAIGTRAKMKIWITPAHRRAFGVSTSGCLYLGVEAAAHSTAYALQPPRYHIAKKMPSPANDSGARLAPLAGNVVLFKYSRCIWPVIHGTIATSVKG